MKFSEMTRILQMRSLKSQADNCERIAEGSELREALLHRARVLRGYLKQMEEELDYQLPEGVLR